MAATIDIIGVGGSSNNVVIESSSVRHFELMKEDYIRLVFSSDKKINIRLGDSITHELWGTFYITEAQKPTYNSETGGYDYDLQFNAPYYKWNNKLYKFEPKTNRNEASWSLTDNLKNHMAVFLRNLEHYGWSYTVDAGSYELEEAARTVFIQFDNVYILDALTKIAEAFNVEWWITDSIIHFGRVESGTAIDFEVGVNVENMEAQSSEKDAITRFYAFGSTQNVPSGYRKNDEQVLLNGVVQKRVMLPADTPYIDIEQGLTSDEIVEGIVIFDDVYPRTKSKISEVIEVEKTVEKNNSTAEATTDTTATPATDEETEKVKIYRFKTEDFTFSENYILAGQTLQVKFESGNLNGMTFDLAFNPEGKSEKITVKDGDGTKEIDNPEAQLFEIVRNDTYGLMLPNETLKPSAEDMFVLIGWDANKMTVWQELISRAEQELKEKTIAFAEKKKIDPLTYPCTMMADYMYGLNNGQQDPKYSKVGTFPLGQRIRLNNAVYFSSGSRISRVVGFEYKLDIPYDGAVIIVGESATYSSSRATEAAINAATDSINYRGGEFSSTGGNGNVYIITSNDTTAPSEGNVYSALRSDRQYARKNRNDNISSLWTFKNRNGMRNGLQTEDYNGNGANEDNLFGKGFELISKPDGNGGFKTKLEIDELFVRIKAFFAKLEIREISYVGGNYCFSAAGGKIYYVEWLDASGNVIDKKKGSISDVATFRCYLYSDDGTTATINKWAVDDQVMCRTFNIDEGVHANTSNKYYWRRCTGIGRGIIISQVKEETILEDGDEIVETNNEQPTEYQYVDISMDDCATNSDFPEAEDTIVQFGNWSNEKRQGIIYLMVEGDSAPAIMEYSGVGANGKHFVLPDPSLLLSPKKNVIYGEFHSVVDSEGSTGSGDSIDDQLRALIDALNDIKNQADKKMEMWFGSYEPLPTKDKPDQVNYPASEWTTDALKALHAQDLFYDTMKAPATQRGRAWRWIAAEDGNGGVTYYWEDVTDQDTIDALEKIADVASDGKLTGGAEKTRVFIDWQKAVQEYLKYKEQAHDYGITTELTEYVDAFKALGKLLNDGNDLVTSDTMTNIPTPSWLADLGTETVIPSPTDYREKWSDYYTTLAALLKEISDKVKSLADEALEELDNMADDNKLTEFEKLQCLREWDAAKAEYTSLATAAANIPNMSSTTLANAFNILSNYLNDKSKNNTTAFTGAAPALLITPGNTEIEGDVFQEYWRNYYDARSSLLAALSSSKVSTFMQASRPAPPYKAGDLWIQTDNDNNVMICIVTRNAGETGYDYDWADLGDLTEKRDPRILIAALVNMVYSYNGGYIKEKAENDFETIYLGEMPSTGRAQGDLAYSNGDVYQYVDGWEYILNETLRMSFKALHEIIGNYNIRIFRTRPTITPKLYDIVCSPLTFTDTNLPTTSQYRTVEGGIQIQMYNGTDWEILQESTHSLIENLKGYVRALAMKSAGDYSTAAGFITAVDWATLFAEAEDADGNKIAQAHLSAYVQKDSDGNIVSGVKIGADQITFEGKTFSIGAEHITLSGTDDISLMINGVKSDLANTGINIQEGKITLNANNTIISGNLSLTDPDKGVVIYDSYGNPKVSILNNTIGTLESYDLGGDKRVGDVKTKSRTSTSQKIQADFSLSLGSFSSGQTLKLHDMVISAYHKDHPFDTTISTITYIYNIKCGDNVITTKSGTASRKTAGFDFDGFSIPDYTNNSVSFNGEYILNVSCEVTLSGTSLSWLGNYTVRIYCLCRKILANIIQIATDGAMFASSNVAYNWFGSDKTQLRNGAAGIRLRNGRIQRNVSTAETPTWNENWGDISTMAPLEIVNGLTYTATENDGFIVFSSVIGSSDGDKRTLTLPNPSNLQGKVYYIKNIVGDNTEIGCVNSGSLTPQNSSGYSNTVSIGNKSAIAVSCGFSWVIFYCG